MDFNSALKKVSFKDYKTYCTFWENGNHINLDEDTILQFYLRSNNIPGFIFSIEYVYRRFIFIHKVETKK